jgi:hypothetical protein
MTTDLTAQITRARELAGRGCEHGLFTHEQLELRAILERLLPVVEAADEHEQKRHLREPQRKLFRAIRRARGGQ